MTPLPLTPKITEVIRRVIWFEEPSRAIADPIRLVSYAMTYGTHDEMKAIRQHLSDDDLREVLVHAPPGIFDGRSWAYWNLKLGRWPTPPLPERSFAPTSCRV